MVLFRDGLQHVLWELDMSVFEFIIGVSVNWSIFELFQGTPPYFDCRLGRLKLTLRSNELNRWIRPGVLSPHLREAGEPCFGGCNPYLPLCLGLVAFRYLFLRSELGKGGWGAARDTNLAELLPREFGDGGSSVNEGWSSLKRIYLVNESECVLRNCVVGGIEGLLPRYLLVR